MALSTGTKGILIFADDIAMMAETIEVLQHYVEVMNEALIRWDLRVNWKTSKVITIARRREESQGMTGRPKILRGHNQW